MNLRYKVLGVSGLLLVVFLYGRYGNRKPSHPGVLPKGDTEQITVDPSKHQITIVTPSGPKVITLPDRPSTFDIHQDGTVKVTSSQLGFEHHIFLGGSISDIPRIVAGVDLGYFKRLDLGLGIGQKVGPDSPVMFAKVSYNFWSNCQAGLTYDNHQHSGIGLTVRI